VSTFTRFAVIACAAALAACGGGGGGAEADVPQASAKPAPVCTVSLYGDSILWGGYANGGSVVMRLEEPPAAALKRMRPKYEVTDFSLNGDSATVRLPSFLNDAPPGRIVVLQYGVNDTGMAPSAAAYAETLRSMVQRVKALNKTPVITGLSRSVIPKRDLFDDTARRVAYEESVVFADWSAAEWFPDTDVDVVGGAHPKQAYSLRLVERLAVALDRAAPECSQ